MDTTNLFGMWLEGDHKGVTGAVVCFRAGLLVTRGKTGEISGPPVAFRSNDGLDGCEILERILIPPTVDELRYGAIRESIAAAASVAKYGFSETRAWDGFRDYIVDTGEGGAVVVRFEQGCVAALVSIDPARDFSVEDSLIAAPPGQRKRLLSVLGLPFFRQPMAAVTAVFWSVGDRLVANEKWPSVYEFGAEILSRELSPDREWRLDARAYYQLRAGLSSDIVSLARSRATIHGVIDVAAELIAEIAPPDAPHHGAALELLNGLGLRARR